MKKRELREEIQRLESEAECYREELADHMAEIARLEKTIRSFQTGKVSAKTKGMTLLEVKVLVPDHTTYSKKDCIADAMAQMVRSLKRRLHIELEQETVHRILDQ